MLLILNYGQRLIGYNSSFSDHLPRATYQRSDSKKWRQIYIERQNLDITQRSDNLKPLTELKVKKQKKTGSSSINVLLSA